MTANSAKSTHVLIALRSESQLNAYQDFLTREGFRVTTTNNALACWAELECDRPDILVLEQALPWGGGDGVLAMLDAEPEIKNIPIVVISEDNRLVGPNHANRIALKQAPSPEELSSRIWQIERSIGRRHVYRAAPRRPIRNTPLIAEKVA